MFDSNIVMGAQLTRAIPGAVERTLRAAPCIGTASRVVVIFHGDGAACAINRSAGAAPKATKRNPRPAPVYSVTGNIRLPSVDANAALPRSIATEWLSYGLHEVFHGIYTERADGKRMLEGVQREVGAAISLAALHRVSNSIEDARIENAAVRHGIARGYAKIGEALVLKHWNGDAARASRERACVEAREGNVKHAFAMLPGVIAYYGRLWLPADVRTMMRAELPACILPTVDAACSMLAALEVRTLDEAAHGDAQERDVAPILRLIVRAMLDAKAPPREGKPEDGEDGNVPGADDEGEDDGMPGDDEVDGKPVSKPGDGQPADDGADDGQPGDDEGQPGANEGQPGDDEGEGADSPEAAPDSPQGGSNQTGAEDAPAAPQAPTAEDIEAEPMNADATLPIITPEVLAKVGADNPLSEYGNPKARKAPDALPSEVDAEVIRARHAVKNPGAIAAQLRRILSKTDVSEHRRGLSHGRLRVQALPRALASGAGAFQRRMDSGADRCSIVVAVDLSSSMNQRDGQYVRGQQTSTRADSAGAFAMLLLDALRGAHGSNAYVFGFGGSANRDDYGRLSFTPSLIKGWQESYQVALRRAASVRSMPHGGTPIRPALAYAVRELRNAPVGRKILIVLTDADFQGAAERPLVEQAEREGVLTIGVGVGADASQIGNLFPRHNIAVADVAQLSEKVCRTLADAVLSADGRR